ncbi:hypothetical protein R3W88_001436 [Solanum pinnatisectum]|uniref:Uncharacterized protein n=1 Tax=Solanum pinnatisectum TaxID=50273 RepID=A0AAV9MID5_9SOLN|nr:hypothetical protein R3W88_001436 [Solanum pinnatisectum]
MAGARLNFAFYFVVVVAATTDATSKVIATNDAFDHCDKFTASGQGYFAMLSRSQAN